MSRRLLALVALLTQLLLACAPAAHRPLEPATPLPTPVLAPIQLPRDDAPHADLTEWWYYTGHLAAADGAGYGFELVIFQVERQGVPIFYAAHYAITDHQRGEFHYDQKTWTRDAVPTSFDLENGNWFIKGDGKIDRLGAAMPGYQIQLAATSTKPPALHGGDGIISFGPAGESYYYSDTRMAVQGTIDDHGNTRTMTGEAWKDRQWGNFLVGAGGKGGWDWYSLQLGDGRDLMLFVLRDASGAATSAYGTLVEADGRSVPLDAKESTVRATGSWTSPHTHATYPSGWSIQLSQSELSLAASPVLRDQELDTRPSTGTVYWEGEVTIDGTSGGHPVTGTGYVELTGYAGK